MFLLFLIIIFQIQKVYLTKDCDNGSQFISAMDLKWPVPIFMSKNHSSRVLKEFMRLPTPKSWKNIKREISKNNGEIRKFDGIPGDYHLSRRDENPDSEFYKSPRLLTHIHDDTIKTLRDFYKCHLKEGSRILDLCSSWISHLPKKMKFEEIIGVGLNKVELQKNSRLTSYKVRDLNKNPYLEWIEDESLDAVLIVVSIDYLIQPLQIFREVLRTLKSGTGKFIITFSNRMFMTKAIKAWRKTSDSYHFYIVNYYFQTSSSYWDKLFFYDKTKDVKSQSPSGGGDPLYIVIGNKSEDYIDIINEDSEKDEL